MPSMSSLMNLGSIMVILRWRGGGCGAPGRRFMSHKRQKKGTADFVKREKVTDFVKKAGSDSLQGDAPACPRSPMPQAGFGKRNVPIRRFLVEYVRIWPHICSDEARYADTFRGAVRFSHDI